MMWESLGYRSNLLFSYIIYQISWILAMNSLLKYLLQCRLTLYSQIYPNQNNSGFSHMLPFLKAFFMQSNLAETKQKLSTFLGKEIDFIAGLGINFSVGKVLLG